MNKLLKLFENIGWAGSHPLLFVHKVMESDVWAPCVWGLVSTGGWFFMYFSSPVTVAGMSFLVALCIGVGIFFLVTFGIYAAPTDDELYGRAPKRLASKILPWVLGLMITSGIFIGFLFIHFMK